MAHSSRSRHAARKLRDSQAFPRKSWPATIVLTGVATTSKPSAVARFPDQLSMSARAVGSTPAAAGSAACHRAGPRDHPWSTSVGRQGGGEPIGARRVCDARVALSARGALRELPRGSFAGGLKVASQRASPGVRRDALAVQRDADAVFAEAVQRSLTEPAQDGVCVADAGWALGLDEHVTGGDHARDGRRRWQTSGRDRTLGARDAVARRASVGHSAWSGRRSSRAVRAARLTGPRSSVHLLRQPVVGS